MFRIKKPIVKPVIPTPIPREDYLNPIVEDNKIIEQKPKKKKKKYYQLSSDSEEFVEKALTIK